MNNSDTDKKHKKNGRRKFIDLFRGSLIISFLLNLSDYVYQKISESFIGNIFSCYDSEMNMASNSLAASFWNKINIKTKVIKPLQLFIIKGFENSVFLNFIMTKLKRMLLYTVSVYGVFLFSFGIYTGIVYFLSVYAFNLKETEFINLAFGIGVMLVSIPLMLSKKQLSTALCESVIARFILFDVIGIRYESIDIKMNGGSISKINIAFIFGMILGLVTYFASPLFIFAGIILLLGAYTLLMIPEFGIVILFFVTPFLPTMLIAVITIYVSLCYLMKLIRGKRTLKFELIDVTVLIFTLLMILGGLFSVAPSASLKPAMLYVCFMLGYFLVVNLIRTSEWVKRCVISIVMSSFIVAIYGVYENFFGMADTTWQDEEMFEDIRGRVVSTFENPNVLAEYLIMTLLFTGVMFLISKNIGKKVMYLGMAGIGAACLIFTWSRGAWLGLLIGAFIFLLIYNSKSILLMIFGVMAVPFLPFVLPQNIIDRFLSIGSIKDTSTSYRVNIWRAVIDMIQDHFASGIGVGEGAFAVVYPEYSLAGIESAPHSHNLFLQIVVEVGVFGLLVFIAAVIIYMQGNFSLYNRIGFIKRYKADRLLSAAGFSGIVSVLAQGMTDYIWYNYRVFFVFWLIFGLTIAIRRSALAEWIEREDIEPCIDLVYDTSAASGKNVKKRGKKNEKLNAEET
jgi:Lipid A core - O-antigen ligase and related enzymes